jgi:hypothetical protein
VGAGHPHLPRWLGCVRVYLTKRQPKGEIIMLYTIVVVLVILWLLGFITHVAGGFIHLLLVVALVILIFNLISGRRGP